MPAISIVGERQAPGTIWPENTQSYTFSYREPHQRERTPLVSLAHLVQWLGSGKVHWSSCHEHLLFVLGEIATALRLCHLHVWIIVPGHDALASPSVTCPLQTVQRATPSCSLMESHTQMKQQYCVASGGCVALICSIQQCKQIQGTNFHSPEQPAKLYPWTVFLKQSMKAWAETSTSLFVCIAHNDSTTAAEENAQQLEQSPWSTKWSAQL